MKSGNKQLSCADYHVAWICPLADVELRSARLMLDEAHETPPYNTCYDENTYRCGAINGHTVVIATCSQGETGNVNAGRLTGSMFKTFPNIRMAVLVGIGGGIPRSILSDDPLENLHLGDVVIGWPGDGKPACVYHDRGRSTAGGHFETVGTMQNPDWRLTNALDILMSDHELGQSTFEDQLMRLRGDKRFGHPGLAQDRLFKATYDHIGDYGSNCIACDLNQVVQRPHRTEDAKNKLVFHRGRIATGNAVIRDGRLRDQIGMRCDGALCVEMEAAGVDVNRRCLVIRGIADYADSHKNDTWKFYAAGNAAAFTRELLCKVQPDMTKKIERVTEAPWIIPFVRPQFFVGRETQLTLLSAHISSVGGRRFAIYGLGGCGKTALVLESAYRTREREPTCAIFWVPAISRDTFEQAYRDIGKLLRIPGIDDDKADVKRLVKARLSDEDFGRWSMIIDNADDVTVLLNPLEQKSGAEPLIDSLPHSRKGSILFTTRTREAAIKLAGNNVISLGELERPEAKEVLRTRLLQEHHHQLEDEKIVDEFLNMLAFLALAIVQAVAFINTNGIAISNYIFHYKSSEKDATDLLSKEFEDQGRYRHTKNPVITTWFVSFEHIQTHNQLAAEHLSFMACTANTDVPVSMLPPKGSKIAQAEAFGKLKAYAFITERQSQINEQKQTARRYETFDVHPLVHLAMRSWLKATGRWEHWLRKAMIRLGEIVPALPDLDSKEIWKPYLPHATHLVNLSELCDEEARFLLLFRVALCSFSLMRIRAGMKAYQELIDRGSGTWGKPFPKDALISEEQYNGLLKQVDRLAAWAEETWGSD